MQPDINLEVYEQFLSLARSYCSYYEQNEHQQRQFLSQIQNLLIDLYARGRHLPEVPASDYEFDDLFERDDKQIRNLIAHKVPFSYYWTVLDPFTFDKDPELGVGDLLDDLGDIYLDLKRAIEIYDSGLDGSKQEAYWKLKFDFDYHWGDHCIDAMNSIHNYMTQERS